MLQAKSVTAALFVATLSTAAFAQNAPVAGTPARPVPSMPTPAPVSIVSPEDQQLGKDKVVTEDHYFNHEVKQGKQFHYVWDDTATSGFSRFGDVWHAFGATTAKLEKAPTRDDLNKTSIYLICNPTPSKVVPNPNYISAADADAVEGWVKDGGVLMLFANDNTRCEFEHYNILANRFGITFNSDQRNAVPSATDKDREHGAFKKAQFPDHPIFKGIELIYMKEICTMALKDPAQPLFVVDKEQGETAGSPGNKDIVMATAKVGKGFVYAIADPWVYNEYIDLPTISGVKVQNRQGGENLVRWILPMAGPPAAK